MDANSADSPDSRRFSWTHALGIALVAALAGAGLGWWRPLWLAPPHWSKTPLVYVLLGLAWIPVLIGCARRAARLVILWIFSIAIVVATCAMLITTGLQAVMFSLATPAECNIEPLPDHQVRYTCHQEVLLGGWIYTFEGAEGSAFVRLVSTKLYGM